MEIHNLMEELVRSTVEEICNEDEQGERSYCTTAQCRTDAVCYVLNRMPPRYVSSGRGMAHMTTEMQHDQQLLIDVVTLTHEALHRVTAVRRGYYGTASDERPEGACFNFPTIKGRILDGSGFMPVSELDVTLVRDGETVAMFDERWSNPYHVSDRTPGTYIFWPAPVDAAAAAEKKTFDFELRIHAAGFEPLTHYFALEVHSDDRTARSANLERDHHLPDLYLLPQ